MTRRTFTSTRSGVVHHASAGDPSSSSTVVLLHQTPRSWAEFRAVIPLLAEDHHVIAPDLPGFGDSEAPAEPPTIETWAASTLDLLDALGVDEVHVVGHHTGGVVAVEVAASAPARVRSAVLSSTPFTDAAFRQRRATADPIDAVEPSPDGHHLTELWQRRQAFYPPDRPDLLHAFVSDALKVADPEHGHRAVGRYRMEDRIALVTQPVCVVRALADPFASPDAAMLLEHLADAELVEIEGGMVPLPDQVPERFAAVVRDFLGGRT